MADGNRGPRIPCTPYCEVEEGPDCEVEEGPDSEEDCEVEEGFLGGA